MKKIRFYKYMGILCISLLTACGIPKLAQKDENTATPEAYIEFSDSTNIADLKWSDYFSDPYLTALIDSALHNNQELNIIMQEINIYNNEVTAKKGEYLPFLNVNGVAGIDKSARYTIDGAVEENVEILAGEENPTPIQDYGVQFTASWEIDVWRKLRNSRDASVARYLASIEGKNFMVTKLVSEVASSYYELLALDKQLAIIEEYIVLQNNALKIVKLQKQAGETTELAVRKFEAEVLNTKAIQFDIEQAIVESENQLNFLLGRFPQPIPRNSQTFESELTGELNAGLPSQLLENRPDIKAAELKLIASRLDVKVAKARFYPSFDISAGIGLSAFNPVYLIKSPQSLAYGLAADLAAPLINRKAIKASYMSANSNQIQAVYDYERSILNAYLEVYNQVSKMDKLEKSYDLKKQEVAALNSSVSIASQLFMSAKADYMEILLTQRDALDSQLELIEYRKSQFITMINLYKTCGGGWK